MCEMKMENALEALLITVMKNADKDNRILILEQYTQRYGGLSKEAYKEVIALMKEG